MNRDRRGESRQVLGAVRDRHEAIAKIEKQMVELAELFQDMERMVVEQEPMVEAIETGANETHENVVQANTQLKTATDSARAARKKKWICFWIVGGSDLILVMSLCGNNNHVIHLLTLVFSRCHHCRNRHRYCYSCEERCLQEKQQHQQQETQAQPRYRCVCGAVATLGKYTWAAVPPLVTSNICAGRVLTSIRFEIRDRHFPGNLGSTSHEADVNVYQTGCRDCWGGSDSRSRALLKTNQDVRLLRWRDSYAK